MEIQLNQAIKFPVENIGTNIDLEHLDFYTHYMAMKLARKHYIDQGYNVLFGSDFESNIILYRNSIRAKRYLDDYTKVKIGRARPSTNIDDYAEKISVIGVTDELLHICRLCSYVGDPGFPDLILIKGSEWHLKYVFFDELTRSQKLFLFLAKVLDIPVDIIEISASPGKKVVEISPSFLISEILSDSRAIAALHGIEEAIEAEKKKLGMILNTNEAAMIEDEIEWLMSERSSSPFSIFRKWADYGVAKPEDISESMKLTESVQSRINEEFEEYERQLMEDINYLSIAKNKTEEYMRKKVEIMQKKFAIGPSKAKALLRFMES